MKRTKSVRVLLCCETGEGRGHATTLATVTRALGPRYACQAIIPRLDHADILKPVCTRVDRGAFLARLSGRPPPGRFNWAVWLHNHGYADAKILREQYDWWASALIAVRPALVVADYGPTALLAARAHGIPSVAVGATYGLPAPRLESFPDYLTREQAALQDPISDDPELREDDIRECVNETLGPLGLPSLARLPEIYAADLSLPHGVSIWDPYAKARTRPLVLPMDPLPPLKRQSSQKIFIYLSTPNLTEPAIWDALRRLPFDACLVPPPDLSPDIARKLARNPRLTIAPGPLPRNEIVQRSSMIVCEGQAGTLSLAVLTGLPVVALPMQHEQLSNALRAAEHLSSVRALPKQMRTADTIVDAITEIWEQPSLAASAQISARELRSAYTGDALSNYREPIRLLMQARH